MRGDLVQLTDAAQNTYTEGLEFKKQKQRNTSTKQGKFPKKYYSWKTKISRCEMLKDVLIYTEFMASFF